MKNQLHEIVPVKVNDDFTLMIEKEVYDAIIRNYEEKTMAPKNYSDSSNIPCNVDTDMDCCLHECNCNRNKITEDAIYDKAIELMEDIERNECHSDDEPYITERYSLKDGDLEISAKKDGEGKVVIEILHGETNRLLFL